MSKPLSLALLICDTPVKPVLDQYGDYERIYTDLLRKSYPESRSSEAWSLKPYDAKLGNLPTSAELEDLDGVIITGSSASAGTYNDGTEENRWIGGLVQWVSRLLESSKLKAGKLKLVGVCFGHQVIAIALGGRCARMSADGSTWELGCTDVDVNDLGSGLFAGHESVKGGETKRITVQQLHRDAVFDVPLTAPTSASELSTEVWCSTSVCENQGMLMRASTTSPIEVLTMQFHPEFTAPIISIVADVRIKAGIIPEKTGEELAERRRLFALRNEQEGTVEDMDGVRIGRLIWRVLLGTSIPREQ